MLFPIVVIVVIRMATWVCSEELFTINSMPLDVSIGLCALKVFQVYPEIHWLGY
jgi:hypothetical protein